MPRTIPGIWLLLAALLLGGCASRPPDPPQALPDPTLEMPQTTLNGAIYQAGHDIRLYEDRSARRVGDLLTIVLEEETDAAKDASMDLARESQLEFAAPLFGGEPLTYNGRPLSAAFDASQSFDGGGAASQSNELTGTITAIVTKVYPNGNLRVEGQKKLTLNRGDEYVTITGIVRPDDVSAGNTVSSTRVALSKISYTGTGALADSSSMGWLSRIFMSVFSPF
jgi:flagellar L-ring protein precursor FlgH